MSFPLMRKMTMAGLLALIGLMPEVVLASSLPASVKAAAATLVNLGYTEVAVSFRVFGGYVLQGKLDDTFVMVALAADGTTIVQTELFRDLDGNGVFGQDESLGANETQPLQAKIKTALSDPGSVTAPVDNIVPQDARANNLDIPGYVQDSQLLFAGSSITARTTEKLGTGAPSQVAAQTLISVDSVGDQDHGVKITQEESLSGLRIRDKSTVISQPNGASVSFTQPDAEAIRSSVASATPDASALSDQIQSKVPTADAIRATISAPP